MYDYYLEVLRASEGTLSRWSQLQLQSLAHKEGLCPSSGNIDWLTMMILFFVKIQIIHRNTQNQYK
jgi:hypothetical protein